MENQLVFIEQLKSKFQIQLEEKKLDNMVYKMKKSNKIIVGYNKATLEQLAMDLGLRKVIKDKSLATTKGVLFVAELELKDSEDRLVASAIGYANTEESKDFKFGGGERDTLRLGAVAQKRALGLALTPILVRYGLDYETQAKSQGLELEKGKQYETTSNVEDLINQKAKPNNKLSIEQINNLQLLIQENDWMVDDMIIWFEHNMGLKPPKDISKWKIALLSRVSVEYYNNLIKYSETKGSQNIEEIEGDVVWDI